MTTLSGLRRRNIMKLKIRNLVSLIVAPILLVSCGPRPIAIGGDDLAIILVADTFSTFITNKEGTTDCSVTPDGLGQSYGSKESSDRILAFPHGRYVYGDVIYQASLGSNGYTLAARNPDRPSDPSQNESYNDVSEPIAIIADLPFVKRLDLYVE